MKNEELLCHSERSNEVAKSIYETWGFSPLVELGSKEQDLVMKSLDYFVNKC